MLKNDKKDFWDKIEKAYPKYPTVRHRKNFVIKAIKKYCKIQDNIFIFDFGCGNGDILDEVKKTFSLNNNQLGGSDTSRLSIETTKQKINSKNFYNEEFPKLNKKCDIIICSEVVEHTTEYLKILEWFKDNLQEKGIIILSTQAGKMYKIDEYSGHTQTFEIIKLKEIFKMLGFDVLDSKLWGWPFFSLQKFLTNYKFDSIKDNFLEGNVSTIKKIFLEFVYLVYFIHNFLNKGPQIFLVAKKR